MSKFKATQNEYNNGFHMVFENGYTISVQFGKANYSDKGKTTAEVAAWDSNGEWIQLGEHDDVKGWCSPEEVVEIMNKVANSEFSNVGDDIFLS